MPARVQRYRDSRGRFRQPRPGELLGLPSHIALGPLTPSVTAPVSQAFRPRDASGRFRRATPSERRAADIRDIIATVPSQQPFVRFRGKRTKREFALRRDQFVALDEFAVQSTVERVASIATVHLYGLVLQRSPVDTGLMRSSFRIVPDGLVNPVPYTMSVERRYHFIARSIRDTMRWASTHRLQTTIRPRTTVVRIP